MFSLASTPLDPAALKRELLDAHAGACVTFEGWVRDHNDGRPVSILHYEAYPALAAGEGAAILAEARARFAIDHVVAVHRVGTLAIGDLAVWVGVSSAHRAAAFDACRFVIDEIKTRVPIWKKEHYADAPAAWIDPS